MSDFLKVIRPGFSRQFRAGRTSLFMVMLVVAAISFGCKKNSSNTNTVANANSRGGTSSPVTAISPSAAYNSSAAIAMPEGIKNAELNTLDGRTLKLGDFSGRVVVLNLWATWCGPCKAEMPELMKMSDEFKPQQVEFIGLSSKELEAEYGGSLEDVKNFVRGYKVPYDIVFTDNSFVRPLLGLVNGAGAIPQSFVISKDGKFVAHFRGYNPVATPEKMRAVIQQALTEAPQG
jgi:thiol-disulfide isomerase/thioredoxin